MSLPVCSNESTVQVQYREFHSSNYLLPKCKGGRAVEPTLANNIAVVRFNSLSSGVSPVNCSFQLLERI